MVPQNTPAADAARLAANYRAAAALGAELSSAESTQARRPKVPGLGKLGSQLFFGACGGALAYTKLLPRGVPCSAGVIGAVSVAGLRGLGVLPKEPDPAPGTAHSALRQPFQATMWAAMHVLEGAFTVVMTPAFRLARLPLVVGGALLGAAMPLLAAGATYVAVGSDREAAGKLLVRAQQFSECRGLWGRLSFLVDAATGAGVALLLLGAPPVLLLPSVLLFCSDICVRGVATGVAFGCSPRPQGVAALGAMACRSAACTVQLGSVDWRTLGRAVGRLVRG